MRRGILAALVAAVLVVGVGVEMGGTAMARSCGPCPPRTLSDLNLRATPGLDGSILDVVPEGTELDPTGEVENGFAGVEFDGQAGWVFAYYLNDGTGGHAGSATVLEDLNLRVGPAMSEAVLQVMPAGAAVTIDGDGGYNGYLPVIAPDGTSGWAARGYLELGGGEVPQPIEIPAVTTTDVNFRTGPSTGDSVIGVLPAGELVFLQGDYQNGFASVRYGSREGWIHNDYLLQSRATVSSTGGLNLREEPSLNAAVLTVMPDGAEVLVTGEESNGFTSVSYMGIEGWAAAEYLT